VSVYNPNRRQLLRAAGATLVAAPVVATGAGFISRNQFQLNEIEIKFPNLPRDLHGLRLVQITDIHLSPFLSEREFSHAIDMANETKAHIALVTGDLITRTGDPLDACIRQLARLRTGSVRLGCMGNHEFYTGTERYVQEQCGRIGIDFLRAESTSLRFGDALINFAGVDYQHFHKPYLVGAQSLVAPGRFNVLLSHNPDVFPVAAGQGFDLTIAGHTHGGQVNFEILHQNLDIALAFTPYVRGLYWRGNSAAYVSSGIGTIGVPVRLGAPAEVSLITLCAS
jgi:predicted MPP superfamily phosphohydrolase